MPNTKIKESYDYIIIGSGFGGSVSALRLAEKGYSVLVVEKGKDFSDTTKFPKTNWNLPRWMWLPQLKFFGIQQLTFFKHISVLSGVGVGGGSLVYANTLPKPKSQFFNHGPWKNLNNWEEELSPYYDLAWKMLGAQKTRHHGDADHTMLELAKNIGREDYFDSTKVSVYFGEEGKEGIEVADPYFDGKGPTRSGCISCGACMTGCRYNAKNTLDKNYLYLARQLGVDILAENKVINVSPLDGSNGKTGYEVTLKESTRYFGKTRILKANGIIFSAGVLGTINLLLDLKKTTLPNLSPALGDTIRTNNEALILNTTYKKDIDMTKGVAIGSIIDIDEHSHLEPTRYGKGSGFWRVLMVPMISEPNFFLRMIKLAIEPLRDPIKWFKVLTVKDFAKQTNIHLFMQHLDSTLKFKKGIFGMRSVLSKGAAPTAFIKTAHQMAKEYCKIIDGKPMVMFTETLTGIPSTAHILGGACMGESEKEGVINKDNKVFNYENMYVFDGSMISANPGVNPSLSITAITEYGMSKIPAKSN
ncbi:GMC oxidoreductase [Halobacteriovorax sp. RZ-1]|uniref:GMC oxidoreductase n=1 Tax=unclassified Halobacteriovorax TaxID=2639665 RepID=UPI00371D3C27